MYVMYKIDVIFQFRAFLCRSFPVYSGYLPVASGSGSVPRLHGFVVFGEKKSTKIINVFDMAKYKFYDTAFLRIS